MDIFGDNRMEREATLAKCPGMNAKLAARLLRLMPDLGLVSSPVALRLAGLKPTYGLKGEPEKQRNSFYIRRLLTEVFPDILAEKDSDLAYFLRHLMECPDTTDTVALCLGAILRHYNDALRHPASSYASYDAYDGDIFAAENDDEE